MYNILVHNRDSTLDIQSELHTQYYTHLCSELLEDQLMLSD